MKYISLFILMNWISIASLMAYYSEPFGSQAISDRTLQDLEDRTSYTAELPTKDFPTNSLRGDFDEGPPTEGGGTGGPVGVPIGDGIVPIILSALVYILSLVRKRSRVRSIEL